MNKRPSEPFIEGCYSEEAGKIYKQLVKKMNQMQRQANVKTEWVQLDFKRNTISIKSIVIDKKTGFNLGETYLNFSPSKELMNAFENEVENEMRKKNNKDELPSPPKTEK